MRNKTFVCKQQPPITSAKTICEGKLNNPVCKDKLKKISSANNITAKLISKQKIQFNVQQHMTDSRIYQAKIGLTLLKKKLVQRGISREQVSKKNIQPSQVLKPSNKNSKANSIANTEQIRKKPSSIIREQSQENQQPNRTPNLPGNNYQKNRSQKQKNNKLDKFEQPITQKKDFQTLLEQQLKKEQFGLNKINKLVQENTVKLAGNSSAYPARYNKQKQQNNEEEGSQQCFQLCQKGCGRKFLAQKIDKHQQICEKVFQSKRKAFDSKKNRQIGQQISQNPSKSKQAQPKQKSKQSAKKKIAKWKIQSAQLRSGLKFMKKEQLTKQQQQIIQQAKQAFVQCKFCKRKFNQSAAQKHIPFCERKSKQITKINTSMKKKK